MGGALYDISQPGSAAESRRAMDVRIFGLVVEAPDDVDVRTEWQ